MATTTAPEDTTAPAPAPAPASSSLAVPVPVPRVPQLAFNPASTFVGSYGGGDGMACANTLMCLELPPTNVPDWLKDKVLQSATAVHTAHLGVPRSERIARLPDGPLDLASGVTWSLRFTVSSHIVRFDAPPGLDNTRCNLMNQGFLYSAMLESPEGRQGASKWPLVGLFNPVGLGVDAVDAEDAGTGAVSPAAGVDCLHPSDQHVHLVDGRDEWHAGSDMGRFHIEDGFPVGKAWAVCLDLESKTCEVSYLVVVSPAVEPEMDRVGRSSSDGTDARALLDGLAKLPAVSMFAEEYVPLFTASPESTTGK